MNEEVIIRPVEAGDYNNWLEMWHSYNEFYAASLADAVTENTWARILDPASPVYALLATDTAGNALGFANYLLHLSTWSVQPHCLLDDLFVRPEARGKGAGRGLISHLIQLARQSDWDRLYWMTRENNATARHLYDRFCTSDGFVRYVLSLADIQQISGES